MRISRFIAAGSAIAAATSFYYTMAYVSRWEWNRAQMAGTFTVLAAIISAGIVIDGRLREVRRSLDALAEGGRTGVDTAAAAPSGPAHGGRTPSRTRFATEQDQGRDLQDFAWLSVKPERYGVFIPLLVGAGMLASGLAWAFERVFAGVAGLGRRRRSGPVTGHPRLPDSFVPPADTGFDAFTDLDAFADEPGPTVADQAELWLRHATTETPGKTSAESPTSTLPPVPGARS